LGGLVFSHYGDKIGRQPTMIVSMTLMGLASVAMGLLPGYATIGIWAPILLLILRVLQGFALGGESAGANVFSTEVSPAGRRGFFTSLVTSGIFVAWILAVSATTVVQYLGRDELLSWGWRLPFLASILLVALGIWMRLNIEESAVFLKAVKKKQIAPVPVVELLRVARKPAFIVLFAAMAESSSGFFFSGVRLQLRDSVPEDCACHLASSSFDREHNWTVSHADVRRAVGPDRPSLGSGEWIYFCRCLRLDHLLSHAL
jgi:MFS family permease